MLTTDRRRTTGLIILGAGAAVTAVLVLFPSGWVINRINVQIWWFLLQNTPMTKATTPEDLAEVWNIVMFVPLGLGLALTFPRWWWMLVLFGVSVGIETIQYLFFEARHADALDVVMNTTGGVVGVTIALFYERWCQKRSNQSIDSTHA